MDYKGKNGETYTLSVGDTLRVGGSILRYTLLEGPFSIISVPGVEGETRLIPTAYIPPFGTLTEGKPRRIEEIDATVSLNEALITVQL